MKKVALALVAGLLFFSSPAMTVSASSLDELTGAVTSEQGGNVQSDTSDSTGGSKSSKNSEYINNLKDATTLSEASPGASKINQGIKKGVSFLVQVISYGVTVLLTLRVLLDLAYIAIPFLRLWLSNGHQGMAMQGAQGGMQGGMGMGGPMGGGMGMGMGGYGGGMGMGGGMYGRGGYGGGMGGMGMGGMGMGGMGMGGMGQQGMQGQQSGFGRIQLISTQALNAVASESVVDPLTGKPNNALKTYAKDMTVTLIVTPILIVLAVTGVLMDLGFLVGDLLTNAIASVGTML